MNITYNNIKTKFCRENFILSPSNKNISNKLFIKKINLFNTQRDINRTSCKLSSLSSNSNKNESNKLFKEQYPFLRRSYSLLKF